MWPTRAALPSPEFPSRCHWKIAGFRFWVLNAYDRRNRSGYIHRPERQSYRHVPVNGECAHCLRLKRFVPDYGGASVSIIAVSGSGQTAPSATYAFPLKAAVRDTFGNAVPGVPVTFTAPASGPGVVFAAPRLSSQTIPALPHRHPWLRTTARFLPGDGNGARRLSPTLFSLTNTADGTVRLSFIQHPTDTPAGG